MTRLSKSLRLSALAAAMSILLVPPALAYYGQQGHPSKEKLVRALKEHRLLKRDLKLVVKKMRQQGVPYQLTAADEQEIRRLGSYLGEEGLDILVAAIRDNYRPAVRPNSTETSAAEKKAPAQGEPTEEEMKEALLRWMEKGGGQRTAKDAVTKGNFIAGLTIKIEKFEKIGCKPANYGVGYECTYDITASQSYHSNDGTRRGDDHATGINEFLKWFGADAANGTVTRKFARSSSGWVVFED